MHLRIHTVPKINLHDVKKQRPHIFYHYVLECKTVFLPPMYKKLHKETPFEDPHELPYRFEALQL
ncbi:hypothetical protein NQ317_016284 [Molorchus minor]|uniref:Uncharacterized protein n=1 Tax=Molorchus minor TaxID=1323400 RepID=A0ABQ9IWQ0_9CUCU|nr:hypothetical protein NQ317_016284 [Molorchus minor]